MSGAERNAETDRPASGPARPEAGDEALRETLRGGVATLELNRPHRRNALTRELCVRLLRALRRCGADPAVRVVVLTGSEGAFCAGDELGERAESLDEVSPETPVSPVTGDQLYLRVCEDILQLGKPVIAALDGVCVGAGTEIACAADLRVASSRTRIGSGVVRVGHLGNAVLLPRVVGPARATEIFLSGRLVKAEEAHRIGLVDHLAPEDEYPETLRQLVAGLASAPTATIGMYKELRQRAEGLPALQGLRLQDAYHMRTHLEIPDASEGLSAFMEGRRPEFTGATGWHSAVPSEPSEPVVPSEPSEQARPEAPAAPQDPNHSPQERR